MSVRAAPGRAALLYSGNAFPKFSIPSGYQIITVREDRPAHPRRSPQVSRSRPRVGKLRTSCEHPHDVAPAAVELRRRAAREVARPVRLGSHRCRASHSCALFCRRYAHDK
jgi:hypothetical protein